MQLQEIRWGIIGCGDVCEVKSAPAMYKLPGSKVVAVMRRNAEKAADFARRHGVPKYYDNAAGLIADPEVNAVYIATPPDAHLSNALQVAAAGLPAYVEKPMARTYAECMEMNAAFEQAGLPLFVAYYRRYLPNFVKIKSLLEDGAIGEVLSVDIQLIKPVAPDLIAKSEENWRVQPERSGGGYFFDLASHQLDILDYFFGPVIWAAGKAVNRAGLYPAEDLVTGAWSFENGILGSGLWNFAAADLAQKEEMAITGSKGQIRFACFGKADVLLLRDGKAPESLPFTYPQHIQMPMIEAVNAALRGETTCRSTGISAARTNWVMEQICSKQEV